MEYVGSSGEVVRSNGSLVGDRFVQQYRDADFKDRLMRDSWIGMLRSHGAKAAIPNNGWIDRENNSFLLVTTHYNDGVSVGDSVAIGDFDEHRIVDVIKIETSRFFSDLVTYYFEDPTPTGGR